MAHKGSLPAKVLEAAPPGQMLNSYSRHEITFMMIMTSDFVTVPGCLYLKQQSRVLTVRESTC